MREAGFDGLSKHSMTDQPFRRQTIHAERVIILRSPKSKGLQARDAVLDVIARRKLKVGDKLPSEAELSTEFGGSRPTLREAMRLLEQDGLIRTEHGRGRFLSAAAALSVARPITVYESSTCMLRQLGYSPVTRVLSCREALSSDDPEAGQSLGCEVDTPVLFLERLRTQDGQPLVYSIDVIPRSLAPDDFDPDRLTGSLNDLLDSQGRRPTMSTASVSAVDLPPKTARLLGQTARAPWLLIRETCLGEEGRPLIYSRVYHRGDAFSFNFSRR